LVIEADGWLADVPFEALLDEHGQYLIERHAPSFIPLGQEVEAQAQLAPK